MKLRLAESFFFQSDLSPFKLTFCSQSCKQFLRSESSSPSKPYVFSLNKRPSCQISNFSDFSKLLKRQLSQKQ